MHGDLLIKDGRFDEALGEYRAAIKLAPLNPQAPSSLRRSSTAS